MISLYKKYMHSNDKGNGFFTDCQINGVSLRLFKYHTCFRSIN